MITVWDIALAWAVVSVLLVLWEWWDAASQAGSRSPW